MKKTIFKSCKKKCPENDQHWSRPRLSRRLRAQVQCFDSCQRQNGNPHSGSQIPRLQSNNFSHPPSVLYLLSNVTPTTKKIGKTKESSHTHTHAHSHPHNQRRVCDSADVRSTWTTLSSRQVRNKLLPSLNSTCRTHSCAFGRRPHPRQHTNTSTRPVTRTQFKFKVIIQVHFQKPIFFLKFEILNLFCFVYICLFLLFTIHYLFTFLFTFWLTVR